MHGPIDPPPLLPPPVPASLAVLVLQRGTKVECVGHACVLRWKEAFFRVHGEPPRVTGPFPNRARLFTATGRTLLEHRGHRLLEWHGWIVSVDADDWVAGPFQNFDEWLWCQGERVVSQGLATKDPSLGVGGRHVHRWSGLYFLSLDPMPAEPVAFPDLESLQAHARRIPVVAPRARRE